MKTLLLFLSTLATAPYASATLVSYWNFNDLSTTGGIPSNANQTTYVPASGAGTLTLVGWSSRAGTSTPHGISNFGGSAVNAISPDLAGQSLALQGSNASTGTPNNGAVVVIQFDLTGLENPILTYATQGTATGFNSDQWAYSTDNVTYTNFGAAYAPPLAFALQTFDFSGVDVLDNAPAVYLRLTLSGATGASGNNRLENIQINASSIVPEPAASSAFLLGAAALVTRRRRA